MSNLSYLTENAIFYLDTSFQIYSYKDENKFPIHKNLEILTENLFALLVKH